MLQHNFKMLVTKTHPLLSQFLSGDVVICDDCILYGVFTKGRDGEDADHDVQDDGEGEAEDEFDDAEDEDGLGDHDNADRHTPTATHTHFCVHTYINNTD